jgi:hypothetical protein
MAENQDLRMRLIRANKARGDYWEKVANEKAVLQCELDFLGVDAENLKTKLDLANTQLTLQKTDTRVTEFAIDTARWLLHHQAHAMCAGVAKNKELQELIDRARALALLSNL